MGTKWHTVSVKISDEELRIIEDYQKKHNASRSKVIRSLMIGTLYLLKMSEIMKPDSELAKTSKPVATSFFNKKNVKQIEKQLKIKLDRIKPETKAKAIQDLNKVNDDMNKFTNHNPVGAPTQKPRKRGKPKRSET